MNISNDAVIPPPSPSSLLRNCRRGHFNQLTERLFKGDLARSNWIYVTVLLLFMVYYVMLFGIRYRVPNTGPSRFSSYELNLCNSIITFYVVLCYVCYWVPGIGYKRLGLAHTNWIYASVLLLIVSCNNVILGWNTNYEIRHDLVSNLILCCSSY